MNVSKSFERNLEIYIKDSGGRSSASEMSFADIVGNSMKGKGLLENAKMYFFEYNTDEEKIYDSKPIVIGLGKINKNNQLAINLHYMPYDIRKLFLRDLLKILGIFIQKEINGPKLGNPILQKSVSSFTWESINGKLTKKYNIGYCLRQYRLDRIRNHYEIGYENWHLGCVNDQNYFKGDDIIKAQYNYYKYINQ